MSDPLSPIRAELDTITGRFEQADRRAKVAQVLGQAGDQELAEEERQQAEGQFHVVGRQLADLLLLLFRYARRHRPDALRTHLADLLGPELDDLAESIARIERRRL